VIVWEKGTVTRTRANAGVIQAGTNQTALQRVVQMTATEMAIALSKASALVMKVTVVKIVAPLNARVTVAIKVFATLQRRHVTATTVSQEMIAPKSHAQIVARAKVPVIRKQVNVNVM